MYFSVKFDSLNSHLQNHFINLLNKLEIGNMSVIAKYISINREHDRYMSFLNNSFKILSKEQN